MTEFEYDNMPNLFDLEEEELIAKLNAMSFEDILDWFDYHEFGKDSWKPHHLVELIIEEDIDKVLYVFNSLTKPTCKHSDKFIGMVRGGGFVFTIAENPSDYIYNIIARPKVMITRNQRNNDSLRTENK